MQFNTTAQQGFKRPEYLRVVMAHYSYLYTSTDMRKGTMHSRYFRNGVIILD